MYNTLQAQFSDAIQREGMIVNDYITNTPIIVLCRKNEAKNSPAIHTTIYYPPLADITTGQMLTYNDGIYLVINKHIGAQGAYYKSDLLQTNCTMTRFVGDTEINIPAHALDTADELAVGDNMMKVVSGNVEIITADTEYTRQIEINDCFYALMSYSDVNNRFVKNGIAYYYNTVEAIPTAVPTLTISGDTSIKMGGTGQVTATATYNSHVITNANIIYSSSDPDVATIGSDSILHAKAIGRAKITAVWQSQNITATLEITVATPDNYSLAITAADTYTTSDTPTLTVTALKNGTADSTATITWASSDTSIATIDSTGKATFLKAGNVTFTATWAEAKINATHNVIVSKAVTGTSAITHNNGDLYTDADVCSLRIGGSAMPFNVLWKDGNNNVITNLTPIWSVTNLSGITASDITLVAPVSGYPLRCTAQIANNNALDGATFDLSVVDSGNTMSPAIAHCKSIKF